MKRQWRIGRPSQGDRKGGEQGDRKGGEQGDRKGRPYISFCRIWVILRMPPTGIVAYTGARSF
jgi:hypothetical protein